MVKVGDSIPAVELVESNPGDKVDLAKALSTGKGLIIGVPAAFSRSIDNSIHPTDAQGLCDSAKALPNKRSRPFLLRNSHPWLRLEREDQGRWSGLCCVGQ